MRALGFRLSEQKRRVASALLTTTDSLQLRTVSWPRWGDYPETGARAAEALASARSQRRAGWINQLRLRVFGLQYNYWRWFFSQQKSDLAVTWNGLVSARRIFMLAARDAGVRTLFLERGPLPNTITADPVGVNFANGLPRMAAPYLAWMAKHPEADGVWRPIAEQLKQRPSAPRHNTSGRAPPPIEQPFVFLPLQKQGDTQLRFFGRSCTGVRETIAFVGSAARSLPAGWHIRLKQHPSDTSRFSDLLEACADLPLFIDNESDTFTQVRSSRLVLTVNSSVGLEAMMLGARVGVMGEAFWAIPGAVADAGSSAALARLLEDPEAIMPDLAVRNALLSFLVAEYYPSLLRHADGSLSNSDADREKLARRICAGAVLREDGSTP